MRARRKGPPERARERVRVRGLPTMTWRLSRSLAPSPKLLLVEKLFKLVRVRHRMPRPRTQTALKSNHSHPNVVRPSARGPTITLFRRPRRRSQLRQLLSRRSKLVLPTRTALPITRPWPAIRMSSVGPKSSGRVSCSTTTTGRSAMTSGRNTTTPLRQTWTCSQIQTFRTELWLGSAAELSNEFELES